MSYYKLHTLFAKQAPSSLLSGLAAYYKLDESSGSAVDASGNGKTGTVTAATQGAAGKIGTAYSFNGTSAFINAGAVSTSAVFTYAAWINSTGTGQRGIICGKSGAGVSGAPYLRVNSSSKVELLKNAAVSIATSIGSITNGIWTHVAVTYDASGNYIFYINGAASGTGTSLQTFTFDNFSIGAQRAIDEWYNGSMDEVGIWNRVLSASEISTLYHSGSGITHPFS